MRIVIVNSHISRRIGGSQVQCDLIARELTRRGHDVHHVAVKSQSIQHSAPYAIHPVEHSARAIGKKCVDLRPDIIYWRYNKKCFFGAARAIARSGIPIIFSVSHVADTNKWASKIDVVSTGPAGWIQFVKSAVVSRWNFRGYKFVAGLVVNNSEHLHRIKVPRQIHVDNSLPPQVETATLDAQMPRPYCLWVASVKPQKQPEKFVELAGMLSSSGVDFVMVGQLQSPKYKYLEDKRNWPRNFCYLGARNIGTVNALLKESLLLVHTCRPEGFPNIFIQAWSFSKPVVSLCFDPDGVFQSEGVGFCSWTMEQLAKDVNGLLIDPRRRQEIGARGKELVRRRFDLHSNVDKLERFIGTVLGSGENLAAEEVSRVSIQ